MELAFFAVHAAAFLLSVSLKTVLIFAVAGLVCLGLRRASAASRHLLWAVTLVSLLCLPVFCALLPPLAAPVLPALVLPAPLQHRGGTADDVPQVQASITSPSRRLKAPSSTEANFVPAPELSRLSADDKAAVKSISPRILAQQFNASEGKAAPPAHVQTVSPLTQSKPALSTAAPKPTGAEWLLAVWLIGMTLVLGRMMLGLLGAVRLVRQSVVVTSGPLAEAEEAARRKLGLKARPSMRDGSLVAVPMTFGMVRPIILLPEGAQAWPAERLEAVLLHEMGHIKRGDWMTAMLAEAVCALFWFHPLVWLAARQMRTESEQACDDLVLTSGIPPAEYADHLLEVVRGLTKRRGSMPAVVTMAYKQDITARIKTILATSKNRSAATGRGLAVAMLVAVLIVLPLASVRPVAFAQAKVREQAREVDNEQVQKIQHFTGISNLTVGKPQWDQKLADGTRVRLMSVGTQDVHGNVISYWTPDGLWKQKGDVDTHPSLTYGQRGYQCFYAITFASAERQNTAALTYSQAGEQGENGSGVTSWHNGETIYDRSPALFPENQTKGTVFVHIATGPETILIAAPPLTGATRHLPTGETVKVTKAVVKLFREQRHLTQTTEVAMALPSRFVRDMSEYSFYPVDWNGKRINVQHAGSNTPDTTEKMAYMAFDFRTSELPLSRVKEFRFAYRQSQTATFRNVALQHNSKPVLIAPSARASGASKLPALSSPDSINAPALVNAVGGLAQVASHVSLQLVAASDKPWDNRQWWRPDGTPFIYSPQVFRTFYSPPPRTYPQENSALVFRLTQPRRDTTVEGWQFIPGVTPMTAGFSCVDVANGVILSGSLRKISEGPKTFGVRLRVGAGPWRQEQVRLSPAEGATTIRHSGNGWNGVYEVRRLSATATKIVVMPAAQDATEAIRVVAFDSQGRQYFPGPSFSGMLRAGNPPGPRTEYPLALPLSQIKKLVVETRPYRYVDFRNIARQPLTSVLPVSFTTPTSKERSDRNASTSNLDQIGLALVKYVADHHERFPDAAHWMDQITPYLVPAQLTGAARQQRIAALFHDPASPPDQTWSYSFNSALSGLSLSQIDNPNQIVAVFESSRGVRNSSDSGQSLPQPGRHSGGSDFLFADGHTKWLRAEDTPLLFAKLSPPVIDSSGNLTYVTPPQNTTGWFSPVNPLSRQQIPIQGQVYDRRTRKPLRRTFIIFSQSPKKITAGSIWPSSFTNKAGRFQSVLYPGKNYLMVLEHNRFRLVGRTLSYNSSGNRGRMTTQGTKIGLSKEASSDYSVRWSLPHGYSLTTSKISDKTTGADVTVFTPIAYAASH